MNKKQHFARVAELGCCICKRVYDAHEPGPVELHHLRAGGWGKGNYLTVMPLCIEHHRGNTGIHGLGTKAFEKRYKITQLELLQECLNNFGEKVPLL